MDIETQVPLPVRIWGTETDEDLVRHAEGLLGKWIFTNYEYATDVKHKDLREGFSRADLAKHKDLFMWQIITPYSSTHRAGILTRFIELLKAERDLRRGIT